MKLAKIDLAHENIRAIRHTYRKQLIELLQEKPGMDQITLMRKMRESSQSKISQHLRVLIKVGFLYTVRQGKSILYFPNEIKIENIQIGIKYLIQ